MEKDGLYWPVSPGDPSSEPSPLQRLVTEALADGYKIEPGKVKSYEGYIYRILTAQGKNARGGQLKYLSGSDLTGGFAILAYPVEWRKSGAHTYVIDNSGRMYKKDLGSRTAKLASTMVAHNPDATWLLVDRSHYGEDVNLGPLDRAR